jgi:cytoskeletal protein CcmA (bactofilin family)
MSDGEKTTVPLPSRRLPDIPPLRRDGRDNDKMSSSMSQGSRMTVGPGIELKGEISNCAALVVEGNIDATLDGEALEISQRGVFIGTARVDSADVNGRFEGDLTVSGLLRIENGGSVSGKVRYGRIEVIAGGELSGEISKVVAEDSTAATTDSPEASSATTATEPVEVSTVVPEENVDIAAEGD